MASVKQASPHHIRLTSQRMRKTMMGSVILRRVMRSNRQRNSLLLHFPLLPLRRKLKHPYS
jgi:hypothetical protein